MLHPQALPGDVNSLNYKSFPGGNSYSLKSA
jgi:hypothetical protein